MARRTKIRAGYPRSGKVSKRYFDRRLVNVQVSFTRTGVGFQACVRRGKKVGGAGWLYACAKGSNPRKALAAAFRVAATRLNRQGGAYAGWR